MNQVRSLLRYDQSSIDLKKRLRIVGEEKDELRFPVEYEQYDEVQKKRKVKVFFSYAHADETYKNELNKHLSPLKRSEKIEAWNDEELLPGSSFDDEIKQKLEQSDIIILLISSDFINSDYCYEIEMQNAMTRAERDECYVVPVIVRACLWKETPLRNIIALPKDGKPVKGYEDMDEAYLEVAEGIEKIVDICYQKYNKK